MGDMTEGPGRLGNSNREMFVVNYNDMNQQFRTNCLQCARGYIRNTMGIIYIIYWNTFQRSVTCLTEQTANFVLGRNRALKLAPYIVNLS